MGVHKVTRKSSGRAVGTEGELVLQEKLLAQRPSSLRCFAALSPAISAFSLSFSAFSLSFSSEVYLAHL